jgi:hypothetical protein
LDDVELEFSVIFQDESNSEKTSFQKEHVHSLQSEQVVLENVGTAKLQWNNCYAGWLGGSTCKLSYSVTLKSKKEMELEEQKRKEEAEEEARRVEAERIEAARRKAIEDARIRLEQRTAKMDSIRMTVLKSRTELQETRGAISKQEDELVACRKNMEAAQKALDEEMQKAETLALDLAAAEDDISALEAEQEADEAEEARIAEAEEAKIAQENGIHGNVNGAAVPEEAVAEAGVRNASVEDDDGA